MKPRTASTITSVGSEGVPIIDLRHLNKGAPRKSDAEKIRELEALILKRKDDGLTRKETKRLYYLDKNLKARIRPTEKEINTLI